MRFRRQWPEERGGNIIERFETPPCGRGEKEVERQEGRDRSGPIKYNYFPIEWKLFGNERRAIDDIHTFIKRFSFSLSFSLFPTISPPLVPFVVFEYFSVSTLTFEMQSGDTIISCAKLCAITTNWIHIILTESIDDVYVYVCMCVCYIFIHS